MLWSGPSHCWGTGKKRGNKKGMEQTSVPSHSLVSGRIVPSLKLAPMSLLAGDRKKGWLGQEGLQFLNWAHGKRGREKVRSNSEHLTMIITLLGKLKTLRFACNDLATRTGIECHDHVMEAFKSRLAVALKLGVSFFFCSEIRKADEEHVSGKVRRCFFASLVERGERQSKDWSNVRGGNA